MPLTYLFAPHSLISSIPPFSYAFISLISFLFPSHLHLQLLFYFILFIYYITMYIVSILHVSCERLPCDIIKLFYTLYFILIPCCFFYITYSVMFGFWLTVYCRCWKKSFYGLKIDLTKYRLSCSIIVKSNNNNSN